MAIRRQFRMVTRTQTSYGSSAATVFTAKQAMCTWSVMVVYIPPDSHAVILHITEALRKSSLRGSAYIWLIYGFPVL